MEQPRVAVVRRRRLALQTFNPQAINSWERIAPRRPRAAPPDRHALWNPRLAPQAADSGVMNVSR